MQFKFQGNVHDFPTSLHDITLGQRIEFHDMYGREIFEAQEELRNLESDDKDADIAEHYLDSACKTFSFFSKIPLEEVYQIPINQVVNVYENCMKGILGQQEDIDLETEFFWREQLWVLGQPELNYTSAINFNQFVTSKQIVKAMFDLGHGQWEVLPSLCAVFLTLEGETFDEKWLVPDSDRAKLMLELPLDIALQVGFFLKSSMIMFSQAFQSSVEEAEKGQT